jgi:hypothetical protein
MSINSHTYLGVRLVASEFGHETIAPSPTPPCKAKEKPFKLSDSQGLYLEVKPNGSKLWRFKYRLSGKEKLYAIGTYSEIILSETRAERVMFKKI